MSDSSVRLRFKLIAACLVLGFGVGVVVSAEEGPREVAVMEVSGGALEWTPLIEGEGTTLAVSDPEGAVRSLHFEAGTAATFPLLDEQGSPLGDGTYTWELRIQPRISAELQRAIEAARLRGDERRLTRLERLTAPFVQAGHFTIAGGAVVEPQGPEPVERPAETQRQATGGVTSKDQLVPDDLIIDGKGCIGLGCANNESFGAEALRLKQSVVRLRFEDTSTAANFPARDWQLTINDAGVNGVDRFSIEDLIAGTTPMTIRGGAPNNSLYVDALGKLGVGTATPAQNVHVAAASTPTVRLEQTGGTPRTWELGGSNTSFTIKDVTAGASAFSIAAAAPNNSFNITATGKVGIGLASPSNLLHVEGTEEVRDGIAFSDIPSPSNNHDIYTKSNDDYVRIYAQNSPLSIPPGGAAIQFFGNSTAIPGSAFIDTGSVAGAFIAFRAQGTSAAPTERMRVTAGGNVGIGTTTPSSLLQVNGAVTATQYITSSSRALKQGFERIDERQVLDRLAALPITRWSFVADPSGQRHVGPTAEDFQSAFGFGQVGDGLSLTDVNGVALAAMKALYAELQEQKKAVAEQHALIDELSRRLEEQ